MVSNEVRELILKLASVIGLPEKKFTNTIKKNQSNLLCLLYHDVTKSQFEEHVQFLDRYFQFMDLDEMTDAISKRKFPSDLSISVTFDDGLRTFSMNAFPVVEELDIPVSVYVTTGLIDSEFWLNRQLGHLILNRRVVLGRNDISIPQNRAEALDCGYQLQQGMKLNELIQVGKHKKVTVGAHTMNHRILTDLKLAECLQEIEGSKLQLEKWLRHSVCHFAYPYGKYSSREIGMVQDCGFISSAAVEDEWIATQSDIYSFPRKGTGPMGSSLHWLMYRISR